MVPNPLEVPSVGANPTRDAAIHFGAFLQLKGLLREGDNTFGNIDHKELLKHFAEDYQPLYKTCLVRPELLNTLRKYGVVKKKSRSRRTGKNNTQENVIRVVKHPNPQSVPAPVVISRPQFYVDQTRILRDRRTHSEVLVGSGCRLCQVSFFNEESKQQHADSDLHKLRLLYRENRSSFKSEVDGGSIIVVNSDRDGEVILREGVSRSVKVKVILEKPYEETEFFKIIDLDGVRTSPMNFYNDDPVEVEVTAQFSEPGAYLFPMAAKVKPAQLCLLKDLIFRVESEMMDELAPSSPYQQQKETLIKEMEGPILPVEDMVKPEVKLIVKVGLPDHKAPKIYNKLLLHKLEKYDGMSEREEGFLTNVLGLLCGVGEYKDAIREVSRTKRPYTHTLDEDNYTERFTLLLDFEEMQQEREMKNYDRQDEPLELLNKRFFLKVPDLSEGRPSVRKGDKVHVRLHDDNKVTYEGVIHEMKENGLLLGFHNQFIEEFKNLQSSGVKPKVDVRFTVARYPILNMYRALNLLKKHKSTALVFPTKERKYVPPTRVLTPRPWFNKLLNNNPQQQLAVKKIISKSSGNAPYLVFGPPGTGKTVTLVEAITQIWHGTQTNLAKQLVCAPSNKACNNVAIRLIETLPPTAKILRLYSLSSEEITIPENLRPHSNYNPKTKEVFMPTIEEIIANHIIVTTIVTAGRLVSGGAESVFSFVFIDECGQATEPEALIAVAGLLTSKHRSHTGQLVLAGDPQQLGPILSSQLAKDFGLGISLLERLMKTNDLYKKKDDGSGYDNDYLTKLVQNFRSHPSILEVPNELFYDKELEPKGNPNIIGKAIGWKGLPNPEFPLIFHSVQGIDERESNSPSYFNRQEIERVVIYIRKLFDKNCFPNKYKVKQEDIGVISPYRKQVQKFRKAFELNNWKNITVGSVEEFQGSEKLVIFISTVRSSVALIDEDYRFKLGFLKNPKRFNVSVTRAQALLIVVGNPKILRHDRQWFQLLVYCKDHGAYLGNVPFPEGDLPEHEDEHIAS